MREGERAREREKKKESARARARAPLSLARPLSVSLSEVREVATLSHIIYLLTMLEGQLPHKIVNFIFQLVTVNDKLTIL